MNLQGKIAIVTGATGGIGFEVAKQLGKHGCTVILNGIDDARGAECLKEITDLGYTAEYHGFEEIVAVFGVRIHCVGISVSRSILFLILKNAVLFTEMATMSLW